MKETVLEKVPRILREKLDITKKYVAAVSGGADSLALADALQHCGFRFTVCHVEHGIRAEESLEDAAYVEEFCRQRGIVFCCKHVDAQELQKREKLSLEDAARRLRYRALFQCVEETGADFILTAHQKDDQAETFLLRLLRGSGTRGLGAIRFRQDIVLRPLLPLSAVELRQYCTLRGISWREDASNEDLYYARNRIRKVLIPLLEEGFSPSVTDILCRTAEHLQTDETFLEELALTEFRKRWRTPGENQNGVLQIRKWEEVPAALRFRVLRLFWHHSGAREELSGINLDDLDLTKNVLICNVKKDNVEHFLDGTAKIYYTGKRFPSTVALNKLYYFIPYIGKQCDLDYFGIRDLYLIKIARVGSRREGELDNDPNDLRLVFELQFVKRLFPEYKKHRLQIWEAFTDTSLGQLFDDQKKRVLPLRSRLTYISLFSCAGIGCYGFKRITIVWLR